MTTPRITPRTLKGFRDYAPEAMIPRERLIDTARRVYRSYGFMPIDTPALEYLEILAGKGGEETDKQLYKFQDHGGRWVGLRFDLTVPLARFAAQHVGELGMPLEALSHRHGLAGREYAARPLPRVHAVRLRHHRHPLRRRRHRDGPGHPRPLPPARLPRVHHPPEQPHGAHRLAGAAGPGRQGHAPCSAPWTSWPRSVPSGWPRK